MSDPEQIAMKLYQIVIDDPGSDSDNRWKQGQALVADLANEEWETLRKHVESNITKHKDDLYGIRRPVWEHVLKIIKSVA